MASSLPVNQWKEIAWCGVRFKTPADWHLSQIGIRYLALEDESGPAMEIKWAPVKGKFSQKALLKRFVSLQKKQVRKAIKLRPVSSEWASVLTEFETGEFAWQTDAIYGRGLLLFCPTCRNATLIQFFRKLSGKDDSVATRVLKTFRDHRADGQVLWAAYDIRALVPETFKLKRYRFEAGQYALDFENGSDRIVLHRWAPPGVRRWNGVFHRSPPGSDGWPASSAKNLITGWDSGIWKQRIVFWEFRPMGKNPSTPNCWMKFLPIMRVFKNRSTKPAISRAEALERIPVKNIQITETRLENGEVVIRYPVSMRPFFAGLVKRFGGPEVQIQMKKLQLDELGTSVWDMINGKLSVRQLVERFAKTHRLEAREAEVSVTQFIRELGRRGLIGLR